VARSEVILSIGMRVHGETIFADASARAWYHSAGICIIAAQFYAIARRLLQSTRSLKRPCLARPQYGRPFH
jgi:hypothetical protein